MTCLEWAGVKLVMSGPEEKEPDEDDYDFEPEPDDDDDEEYVDDEEEDDDDAPEDGDDEDTLHESEHELQFSGDAVALPRPLQLNKDYDSWSSAVAPPVFKEEE